MSSLSTLSASLPTKATTAKQPPPQSRNSTAKAIRRLRARLLFLPTGCDHAGLDHAGLGRAVRRRGGRRRHGAGQRPGVTGPGVAVPPALDAALGVPAGRGLRGFRHGGTLPRRAPTGPAPPRPPTPARRGDDVLEEDRHPVGTGQRHPPVGVLVDGAGLVLRTPVADRVGQRDAQHPGRGQRQVAVQGQDRLVDVGALGETGAAAYLREPGLPLGGRGGELRRRGRPGGARAGAGAARGRRPGSPPTAAGRGWSPRPGTTRASARRAAARRRRARTTGSRCRGCRARAGSRAPPARRRRGPRRRRRRPPGAPRAPGRRPAPRGRSGRRCPGPPVRPRGSTTAGTAR